jgi:hypothetical protein
MMLSACDGDEEDFEKQCAYSGREDLKKDRIIIALK